MDNEDKRKEMRDDEMIENQIFLLQCNIVPMLIDSLSNMENPKVSD